MIDQDLLTEIRELHQKLDRVIALLEARQAKTPGPPRARTPKPKALPLTQSDINNLQVQFDTLFSKWLAGNELEVQDELEKFDGDQLRRFADANNLNVTAKMSKQRVLQLIGARFREKRQLHRGAPPAGEGSPAGG